MEALHKSEDRFRTFLDNLSDVAYTADYRGNITYANKIAEKIIGIPLEDIIGKPFLPLFTEESQKLAADVYQRTLKGESPEYELTLTNGKIGHFKNEPLRDKDGKIIGVFGIARDITERKQAEEALRKAHEELEILVKERTAELTKTNEELRIEITERKWAEKALRESEERNRRMVSAVTAYTYSVEVSGGQAVSTQHSMGCLPVTGYNPEDYESYPYLWYSMIHPDDRMIVDNSIKEILAGRKVFPIEHRLIRRDGSIVWVRNTMVPYYDNEARLIKYDGLIEDITTRKQVEEALWESEHKYRDLYDNAPDMYHTLDKNGIIIDCNETEARMLGYKKEEIIGRPVTDFFTEESKRLFMKDFPSLNKENKLLNIEREFVRKDGLTFPAMLNVFSEYDEDGNLVKAKTISRDITISKFAEKALRDSEQKYRDLVDNALVGIFQTTIDGDILYVNEALSRMLEFPTQEAMRVESVLMRYKNIGDREVLIKNLLKEHTVNSFECALLTKTGKTKNVLISATLSNDIISGMIMDITEHRRAEERMTFLAQALNTSPLSVIATNEHGKIFYVNPATEKLYGYKDDELLGKDPIILNADPDAESIQRNILETVRHNKVWTGELLNRKKDGELFYIQDTIYKLTDEKGDFIAFVGFAEDITDRKKLEEQLLHSQKMEAVGQLAGGIAHDFNNILTAIIGFGTLLKIETEKDDLLRSYVTQILTSAERAANLTQALLAFSRRQVISPKSVNINEIIRGLENLLSRIIGEDIELSIVLTDRDLNVMADSGQIEQVVMNLATNARDAMPDGGSLTIKTDLVNFDYEFIKAYGYGKPGLYALLSVEDTGEGIDEETKERIFEPFFTTKEVGKGTGLGLSMVYGIIQQHDGYISVDSERGKETTFKIYLPLIKSMVEKVKEVKFHTIKGGTETVLIAEDDAQVRELMREVLSGFGYTGLEAEDGDDALRVFYENQDKIKLLILDVIMPKKNGKEVYDEIRKTRPDMKAIFTSGYDVDVIHKKGVIEEGLDFISKPILKDELLRKVREVLDKRDTM